MRVLGLHNVKYTEKALVDASSHLRGLVVDYVLEHYRKPLGGIPGNMCGRELIALEYASDATDGEGSVRGPSTYARMMRNTNKYAGITELHALSALLDAVIVVHYSGGDGRHELLDTLKRGPSHLIILHVLFDPQTKHYSPILCSELSTEKG
ncbi:hypothetical protein KFL_007020130 [Klebsormidium nitens]|uniref:Uncharacterized protein n=1 Tax=Klebsormidium nitens TaxID=105231 RepID=A0A1Y1IQA3_KLENI|nr:hypothetical protein KFL_007020130 [Klebsormidium nitens]|eukprot:GAQ90926.1 hypothetical protein KFL_007020130 [Klebsormidium nitens]